MNTCRSKGVLTDPEWNNKWIQTGIMKKRPVDLRKPSTTNPKELIWKTVLRDLIFLFLKHCKCEADQSGCLCFQIFWTLLQIWDATISSVSYWNQPKRRLSGLGSWKMTRIFVLHFSVLKTLPESVSVRAQTPKTSRANGVSWQTSSKCSGAPEGAKSYAPVFRWVFNPPTIFSQSSVAIPVP